MQKWKKMLFYAPSLSRFPAFLRISGCNIYVHIYFLLFSDILWTKTISRLI